jgi:hypothetical protein
MATPMRHKTKHKEINTVHKPADEANRFCPDRAKKGVSSDRKKMAEAAKEKK